MFNLKFQFSQYPIKNKLLLKQCGVVFCVVISLFCLHAAPYFENLSLGLLFDQTYMHYLLQHFLFIPEFTQDGLHC